MDSHVTTKIFLDRWVTKLSKVRGSACAPSTHRSSAFKRAHFTPILMIWIVVGNVIWVAGCSFTVCFSTFQFPTTSASDSCVRCQVFSFVFRSLLFLTSSGNQEIKQENTVEPITMARNSWEVLTKSQSWKYTTHLQAAHIALISALKTSLPR